MKKKYELKVTPAAESDLDHIYEYISENLSAPMAAQRLMDDIEKEIKSLRSSPYRCELCRSEYLALKGYRRLVINKYIALYVVNEQKSQVIIMRVFYGAMDYEQYI